MPFPSIRFSTKKQHKRRHSAFSHHDVNDCDVLSKPFLPLQGRISSPTELIDLAGHPHLAPILLKPPPTNMTRLNDSVSPLTPIPNTDKTLIDIPPKSPVARPSLPTTTTTARIHYTETLYNEEEQIRQAPPILQPSDRRPLRRRSFSPRSELDRLWKQYDQEQIEWRQRLDDYKLREEELMDQLERTRAKLDQLEESLSDRAIQYHHHHHYHHYYIRKQSS